MREHGGLAVERLDGWLVVENSILRWDQGVFDRHDRTVICGELNHVRHLFWKVAWRESCKLDLELALLEFAERVGVEYSPSLSTTTRPATTATEATP